MVSLHDERAPWSRWGRRFDGAGSLRPDGQVVARGMDFVVLGSDDLIARMVVFDGLVPQDRA